jgi:hypothetical protein
MRRGRHLLRSSSPATLAAGRKNIDDWLAKIRQLLHIKALRGIAKTAEVAQTTIIDHCNRDANRGSNSMLARELRFCSADSVNGDVDPCLCCISIIAPTSASAAPRIQALISKHEVQEKPLLPVRLCRVHRAADRADRRD